MKRLIISLIMALPMLAMAQSQTNVTVEAAGQLSEKIPQGDRFKIVELKVSGPLNGTDLKLLQQIVNRTKANEKNGECFVSTVDLSGATIMEGKEGMKTKANELPSGFFAGAKMLTKVILPTNLINISKNCFADCKSLAVLVIPETVTTIGSQAFQNCVALSSIDLPVSLLTIGDEAFRKCTSLTEIKVPVAVTTIGSDAFNGCSTLTKAELSVAMKKIGGSAFQNCPMLREVILNSPNPPSISKSTFKGVAATFHIPTGSQLLFNANKDWQKLPTKEKTSSIF